MWNYWCNLGIYEMLVRIGIEVDLVYIAHFKLLKNLIDLSKYDQIIINDIVHGLAGEGPVINLDLEDMVYLDSSAIPICGIAVESIFTYYSEDKLHDFAKRRLDTLNTFLPFFDSFLCTHIYDVNFFKSKLSKPAMWLKPISFSDFEVVSYGKDEGVVFNGSIYQQRADFLKSEAEHGLMISHLNITGEDEKYWTPIIKNICDFAIAEVNNIELKDYQKSIVSVNNHLRKNAEIELIKGLSRFKIVVHLPAFFIGCHPRVIQSLQAGSLPLTPSLTGIESLWFIDNMDCIYYEPSIKGNLAQLIQQFNDQRISQIIMNGRERNSILRSEYSLAFEISQFLL
jgi:hypothetical protein